MFEIFCRTRVGLSQPFSTEHLSLRQVRVFWSVKLNTTFKTLKFQNLCNKAEYYKYTCAERVNCVFILFKDWWKLQFIGQETSEKKLYALQNNPGRW